MLYRVLGPSAAENFILAMLKHVGFSMAFALREGKNRKKLYRKIFQHKFPNISPT